MREIPPVSSSMASFQSRPQNLPVLAAAALLLAQLAKSAPTSGEMPEKKAPL